MAGTGQTAVKKAEGLEPVNSEQSTQKPRWADLSEEPPPTSLPTGACVCFAPLRMLDVPWAVLRVPAKALAREGVVLGSALVAVAEVLASLLGERESRQELPAGFEGMALDRIWVEAWVHRVPGSQASRRLTA